MEVIPAIDLRGGRCVRLRQGDFGQETVFGDDPAAMAQHWVDEGARRLHLVDLDGAREGRPVNVAQVQAILRRVSIPCQLGGGIRDEKALEAWLQAGLDRVVVGTAALKDPSWFRKMVVRYSGRILLGLDARAGRVSTAGWLEDSGVEARALAADFDQLPLAGIVYTDISRDGTLEGPNLQSIAELATSISTPVIASGGVGTLADLQALALLPIAGCIVGRALYEGRFTLAEAQAPGGEDHAMH
jgi:phosphoribosylformimino-5-aminoimidazole carboxamide ribotide isomerase